MSAPETTPSPPPAEPKAGGLQALVNNRQSVAYALLAAALLFAALGVVVFIKYRWDYFVVWAWCALLAFSSVGAAVRQLAFEPKSGTELDEARILVLSLGGVTGLTTALLGGALAYQWWDAYLSSWLDVDQAKEPWRLLVVLLAVLGGLALMFASLQVARSETRTNVTMRRLLYGYNAVLTGLLLLAILIVIDVFVYLKLTTPLDFTSKSLYTLSSSSKNILEGLDQPLKIYAVLDMNDVDLFLETRTLLDMCRAANPRIQIEELSRAQLDRLSELARRHPVLDPPGLLVLYGTEPDVEARFVKGSAMGRMESDRGAMGDPTAADRAKFVFTGEDALMTELRSLGSGKTKPVLYFTQGNGEPDLNSRDTAKLDVGLGVLRDRLEKRNYEVKPLQFSPAEAKVPDDATIVAVIRPVTTLPDVAVKALHEYMNPAGPDKKKGKLLALLDVIVSTDNTMRQTGLETVLAGFNVQVGNERILTMPTNLNGGNMSQVILVANPDLIDRNPLASAFRDAEFTLLITRPVRAVPRPTQPGRPPAQRYTAESLLLAPDQQFVWVESNLQADANSLAEEMIRDRALQRSKLSKDPVSVAVVVSEGDGPDPNDPHAFMRPSGKQTPRLAVFGDASFATNRLMSSRGAQNYFNLFVSTVDWLRERPSSIGIDPKERPNFTLKSSVNDWRLILLPAVLSFVGILGLGAGVWIVRRR